jgi:hypothetical protein
MGYAPGGGWTRCVSLRCGSCSPPGMGTATTTMATSATSTPTTTASRLAALATATMASHNRYAGALQPRDNLSSGKPSCCPQHHVQPTTHATTRNFQFQASTIQSSKLILFFVVVPFVKPNQAGRIHSKSLAAVALLRSIVASKTEEIIL